MTDVATLASKGWIFSANNDAVSHAGCVDLSQEERALECLR